MSKQIYSLANISTSLYFLAGLLTKIQEARILIEKRRQDRVRLAVTAAVVNINTPQRLSLASFPISQNQRTEEWQSGYSLRRKIGTPLN